MQSGIDCVRCGGLVFQQVLGYHCLLVDFVDICQVMAEGACLHTFPALVTLHIAGVPFGSCDPAALHPMVQLGWKLGLNLAGCTYHCLCLEGVGLQTCPLEQVD